MDAELVSLQRALVERYSVERLLGRGGMGAVYLGRDLLLERPVAIKALPLNVGSRDEARERILREARTAAKLQHPNIVSVHAVEELDDWIVIVMAYIDGGTLGSLLREHGRLPAARSSAIIRDIAHGLAYAHRRGVVHRDIKPDNVLIDRESGRAMVTDFGIAHISTSDRITGPGVLMGTPSYMSPEQASGATLDGRSDLYSLGVVAYLCLTGRLPFVADDARALMAQHVTRPAPAVAASSPEVPTHIATAVDRCLVKEPGERFQSGEELAASLDVGVEKRSELPAALRQWVDTDRELTLSEAFSTPLLVIGNFAMLDFFLNPFFGGSPQRFDDELAMLIGMLAPVPMYFLRRLQLLRRVRLEGYTIADLRAALRETRAESSRAALLQTAGIGLSVGLVTLIMFRIGDPNTFGDYLFHGYLSAFSLGALSYSAYRLFRRGRKLTHDLRRAFWNSALGERVAKIASAGLRGRQRMPEFANRGTEVALGSSAMVLFEALPKALRERLPELPSAIRRLESVALEQRERAQVDTGAGRERHDALRRDAIAALQMLRLDVLRLHAQESDVTSITADIEAALEACRRMEVEAQAREEVDEIVEQRPAGYEDSPQPTP